MSYPNPLKLSIAKVKTWNGREGGGWQCTLSMDGVPVAEVTDAGDGGDIHVDGIVTEKMRKAQDMTAFRASRATADVVVAKVKALCETLPEEDSYGTPMRPSWEMYLAGLVDDHENAKRIARLRKVYTLYRLKTDPNEMRTVKSTDIAKVTEFLTRKYGADGFTLI